MPWPTKGILNQSRNCAVESAWLSCLPFGNGELVEVFGDADDAPHRPAGHHDTEDLSAVNLGEGLGHQRDADDDFGSGANPGEEAIDPKLEGRVRQSLQPVNPL
jgi:hypothetical protein